MQLLDRGEVACSHSELMQGDVRIWELSWPKYRVLEEGMIDVFPMVVQPFATAGSKSEQERVVAVDN